MARIAAGTQISPSNYYSTGDEEEEEEPEEGGGWSFQDSETSDKGPPECRTPLF